MQSAHLLRRRPASAASTCWRAAAALSAVRTSPCVVATPASASAQRTMRPMHCDAVRLHQRRGQGHGHGHSHSHAELRHDEHEHDAKAPLKATAPTTAASTTADAAAPVAAAAAPADHTAAVASPTAVAADAPPAKGPRYYLRKIKAMLQHYTLGAKLLWKNVKTSRAIRKKVAAGVPATYAEHAFLHRMRVDLALGVPFVLVFALPVVGYTAPIFALFAPRYVPATFHTPLQTMQHVRADARSARATIASLQHVLAYHSHACGLEKMRGLLARIERGVGRVQRIDDLLPLSSLFEQLTPSPLYFPRAHLLLLHRALRHSAFVPKYLFTKKMISHSLTRWRQRMWEEDQLLLSGGVDALSVPELVMALYDRGIYRQPIAMGGVLARDQTAQLASVDKRHDMPRPVDPLMLLPEPPSDALVAEWRQTLQEWAQLHSQLQSQVNAALATHKQQQQEHEQLKQQQSDNASESVSSADATKSSSPPTTSASSSGKKPEPPAFPLAFLLHVGPLARVPSTAADLAAVTPSQDA